MARAPVVLLGEVHDNAAQHAVRAAALRRLLESGARPALAFEQFDRERQADLDAARSAPLPAGRERADLIIERAGGGGWNWKLYRPYVALALQYDLPIVAANLSRAAATRVIQQGLDVEFDAAARARLGIDDLPAGLLAQQQREVEVGHCFRLPREMLPRMAQAQIARDAALAEALAPYAQRGVVLLTGNGHARKDIGVPVYLGAALRARSVSIGLLEAGSDEPEPPPQAYDAVYYSPAQGRGDPCSALPAIVR